MFESSSKRLIRQERGWKREINESQFKWTPLESRKRRRSVATLKEVPRLWAADLSMHNLSKMLHKRGIHVTGNKAQLATVLQPLLDADWRDSKRRKLLLAQQAAEPDAEADKSIPSPSSVGDMGRRNTPHGFDKLATEVLLDLLDFVPLSDVASLACTSQSLREIVSLGVDRVPSAFLASRKTLSLVISEHNMSTSTLTRLFQRLPRLETVSICDETGSVLTDRCLSALCGTARSTLKEMVVFGKPHRVSLAGLVLAAQQCRELTLLHFSSYMAFPSKFVLGAGLEPWANLKTLKIEVSASEPGRNVAPLLKACPHLTHLHLMHPDVTDSELVPMAHMSNLIEARIGAIGPLEYRALSSCPNLRQLHINYAYPMTDTTMLSVRSLRLNHFFLSWDRPLVSIFPNLRSLQVGHPRGAHDISGALRLSLLNHPLVELLAFDFGLRTEHDVEAYCAQIFEHLVQQPNYFPKLKVLAIWFCGSSLMRNAQEAFAAQVSLKRSGPITRQQMTRLLRARPQLMFT